MGLFNKIFGDKNSAINQDELKDMGVCPNCWGKQDYDGKFKDYVNDQTKSNINHDKSHQKAFIQQFIETRVTGIKLISDGDRLICKACNS